MELSTIIVSYGTFDMTCDAIESVQASSPELDQEIIVVDNNSPDGSGTRLRDRFSGDEPVPVIIIPLDSNRGFAAANNIGAAGARGDVLVFLNSDTLVDRGSMAELVRFTREREDAGAVGPLVRNADGSDQESISSFVTLSSMLSHFLPTTAVLRRGLARSHTSPRETKVVDIVKGCAIALRREVFESVGGWDDSYFLYAEERELCHALQRAGFQNYFLHTASIVHFGGASTKQEDYARQQVVQQRSSLAYLQRHHGRSMILLNRLLGIIGFGIRSVVLSLAGLLTGKSGFRTRAAAARALFRWFLLDYSTGAGR